MKHQSNRPPVLREGDVIDANSFTQLMLSTYKKNLKDRKRRELLGHAPKKSWR